VCSIRQVYPARPVNVQAIDSALPPHCCYQARWWGTSCPYARAPVSTSGSPPVHAGRRRHGLRSGLDRGALRRAGGEACRGGLRTARRCWWGAGWGAGSRRALGQLQRRRYLVGGPVFPTSEATGQPVRSRTTQGPGSHVRAGPRRRWVGRWVGAGWALGRVRTRQYLAAAPAEAGSGQSGGPLRPPGPRGDHPRGSRRPRRRCRGRWVTQRPDPTGAGS